ncbi:DUF2314 domain-containing protein [Rubritalea profundi]|uniref:DUF2314 domain-containing protein n=1 Tax=Rubritalea profundi TaxID=1658618 RepID=A0A2S7U2T2_9BACT|nr:DUF2314 domain-containing protein [Rubritalea profundi]PQJ29288.1 hypothetical protein BSZ32_12825 [Rubritalea profundi]
MSEEEKYPYATLENDGYELDLIEAENRQKQGFLEEPIPADDERFAVEEGDIVKLVFHYAKPFKVEGKSHSLEHMWAVVTNTDDGIIVGYLDNQPQYTKLLTPGQEINFHPEHIIAIWRGE